MDINYQALFVQLLLTAVVVAVIWIWFKMGALEAEAVNTSRLIHKRKQHYIRYKSRRKELLNKNSAYIKKCEDIWKEQILLKYDLEIELRSKVIYVRDKTKVFKFKINNQNAIDNLWDIMLNKFQICDYDSMLRVIKESTVWEWSAAKYEEKDLVKVDINNCTEKELADLPLISVILAKKIIKYRQDISGFKTKEEFFQYIGSKQYCAEILSDKITVNKIKRPKKIKLWKERKVDF